MAVITENNYISDGVTVLYAVTFDYIKETDVRVSFDGTDTTDFTFDNATQIRLGASPAPGVAIRIYRKTDVDELPATFYPGSTIQASDLNDNFNVSLYVSQEAARDTADASEAYPTAERAEAKADQAIATADAASVAANTANTAALNAQILADSANTNAVAALNTANTAQNTADATAQLVADASLPLTVNNVAAIPASPTNGDLVEVSDSTGIESFSPLAGLPGGFVGEPALAVRLVYTSTGNTWTFQSYRVNDPDARYTTDAEATAIADAAALPAFNLATNAQSTANGAVATANAALPKAGGTMTGSVIWAPAQTFPATGIATATFSTPGVVTLSDDTGQTFSVNDGVAATPNAVKAAYDRANTALNTANNAETTANNAESTANGFQTQIDTANTNASTALTTAQTALGRPGVFIPEADVDIPNTANTVNIASITGGATEPWMKIEIVFRNVNIDGSDDLLVQVGDADGTFLTSGYQSCSTGYINGNSRIANADNGFVICRHSSDDDINGRMTISWLPDDGTNGEIVADHASGWRSNSNSGAISGGGFMGTANLANLNGFPVRFRILSRNGSLFVKGRVVSRLYTRY